MTAMSPLEIPSDTAFAGALMGLADVSLEERREEVLRNFDEIRQRLRPLRQGLSEAKASLDHFAANGITGSDDELDEAIAILLVKEQAAKAVRDAAIREILTLKANARNPPDLLPEVESIARTIDDLLVRWLETLRDLRWAGMIALAARAEPETGSIVSSSEELASWFAELERSDE